MKIGPSRKKNFRSNKFLILLENLFSITTLPLKRKLKSINFLIGEAKFSFGKDSALTTNASK